VAFADVDRPVLFGAFRTRTVEKIFDFLPDQGRIDAAGGLRGLAGSETAIAAEDHVEIMFPPKRMRVLQFAQVAIKRSRVTVAEKGHRSML
jgi:hypothetical protein